MKKKIYFVADMFIQDYVGGAELTTESIINDSANFEIEKVYSHNLEQSFLEKNKDNHFIVCNFSRLQDKIKIYMCKNIQYSIIEYDYKFCKYRSTIKHKKIEGIECDCLTKLSGKINNAFYGYASEIWFMSEKQRDIFLQNVSSIKQDRCKVLSSVFSQGDLRFIDSIKDNEKDETYLILGSDSWIKNTKGCVEYAISNKLKYEVIKDLPYHELLIKMSTSRGLIFMPLAHDTCPRLVIEAKLMGCEMHLNDYVQHKDEEWFSDAPTAMKYLKKRTKVFWEYYE